MGARCMYLRWRPESASRRRAARHRRALRAPHRGSRRILCGAAARHHRRRCAARAASGARRHAVVEAVLPVRRARAGIDGDPAQPKPPTSRRHGRNADWRHLCNADIVSMPDKWEYPWYASWDLAFHAAAFALIDPDFAKRQLLLLVKDRYQHPNGQIARLRVGARRRQSAGACVGRHGACTKSTARSPARRSRLSGTRVPQAAAQLLVVGEPQGRRRPQHLSGRLSRARQRRASSTARRRCRPAATSIRPTARHGWPPTRST